MMQLEVAIRIYLLVMLPLMQFTKHKSQASQENGEEYIDSAVENDPHPYQKAKNQNF